MRRTLLISLIAATAAASLWAAGAQATTTKPSLRVVTPTPLKLAGANFRPSERIRVSGVLTGVTIVRTVTTTRTGTFTLSFPTLTWGGCGGATLLTAVGSKGSRATLKALPRLCIELAP